MAKVSFDGPNRLIIVTEAPTASGLVELDVKIDLYSDWKEWMLVGDNCKYLYAMRAVGGDPTVEGRFLGSTFFLSNGWRIRPYNADHTLKLDGNLFTDEGDFVVIHTLAHHQVLVDHQFSNLIDATVSSEGLLDIRYAVESLRGSYAGSGNTFFWSPFDGDDSANGRTPDDAVKTFAQAQVLAADNNNDVVFALARDPSGITSVDEILTISKASLQLRGSGSVEIQPTTADVDTITITGDRVNVEGITVMTAGTGSGNGVVINGASKVRLSDIYIHATQGYGLLLSNAVADTRLASLHIDHCGNHGIYIMNGATEILIETSSIHENDGCGIHIEGANTEHITVNWGNEIFSNYNYGLTILAGVNETLVNVDSTIQNNTVGDIRDEGTNTHYSGIDHGDAYTAFAGAVHLDTSSGITGTAYPRGTPGFPVDNLQDGYAIALKFGYQQFVLRGSFSLDRDYINWFFRGSSNPDIDGLNLNGQCIDNSGFERVTLTGAASGDCSMHAYYCDVYDVSGMVLNLRHCTISGMLALGIGNTSITDSYSSVPGMGTPIVDFVGAGRTLNMRSYSGGIELRNMVDTSNRATCEFIAGQIILATTCASGVVSIRGITNVTDNSTGTTVDMLSQITKSTIDDELSGVHGAGSWEGAGGATWTDGEKEQIRDSLGVDGVKTTAIGGQLQDFLIELEKVRHADGVFISDTYGSAGTTHDIGTRGNPVKGTNLNAASDAVVIATTRGTRKFVFVDDTIYTLGQSFPDWVFEGETVPVINMNGQDLNGTVFDRCFVYGTGNPSGLFESFISNAVMSTVAFRCVLGVVTVNGGSFYQCFYDNAQITLGGTCEFRGGSGEITLYGLTGGGVDLDDFRGRVVIDSSCTGGAIRVSGIGKLTDNSGAGCSVTSDAFVSLSGIDAELSAEHGLDSWESDGIWSTAEKDQVIADVTFIRDMEEGRWELTDEGGGMWVVYDADNTTIKAKFATFDSDGVRTRDPLKIVKRTRVV